MYASNYRTHKTKDPAVSATILQIPVGTPQLTAPAVPLFVVIASPCSDDQGKPDVFTQVSKVVAIECRLVDVLRKEHATAGPQPVEMLSVDEYVTKGRWTYLGRETKTGAIFIDPESGELESTIDRVGTYPGEMVLITEATAAEIPSDDVRMAKIVANLAADAMVSDGAKAAE